MKLVTFNINGVRARLPRLLEYLEREQPDIACLQELKCADDSLPIADIEGAGYNAVWHGQKGFNGVAILSKGEAPKLRQLGLPGDPDDTAPVITVDLRDLPGDRTEMLFHLRGVAGRPGDENVYDGWDSAFDLLGEQLATKVR